jgi:hypothetical protein
MSRTLGIAKSLLVITLGATVAACAPQGADEGKPPAAPAQEALCKHEVADRFCPLCHPEIQKDPDILLCKEHENIPEEICTACHPELKAKYKTCTHELPHLVCRACAAAAGGGDAPTHAPPTE